MGICVGYGIEVVKDRFGDRQPLSGGAPYSGFLAVCLLGRLDVGNSVAFFLMGRVGQSFPGGGVVGGLGDSIGKGGGGLDRCGGCCWVSGWELLYGAMMVMCLSG